MRLRISIPGSLQLPSLACAVVATVAFAPVVERPVERAQKPDQNRKPSISLRANPTTGFSPLRVVLTAELKGGANDYEEFYCASVEWDWGDDTKSETKADCDPYEPGKSEIKRRYAQEHTFRSVTPDMPGAQGLPTGPTQFRVRFLLKQKNKVVGSGQTTVEVRSGFGG
jgi:hypothetical protein